MDRQIKGWAAGQRDGWSGAWAQKLHVSAGGRCVCCSNAVTVALGYSQAQHGVASDCGTDVHVSQWQAGKRDRCGRETPLSSSSLFSYGPGRERKRERESERERERETAPSTSPLTYISSVIFSTLPFFLHLLFLLYQQLYNCDVMTKAGVMEAQAGRVKTGRRRQKNGMKERGGDSQRLKR